FCACFHGLAHRHRREVIETNTRSHSAIWRSHHERLLAEPSKKTKKTTNAEMEAALLRLNPPAQPDRRFGKGNADPCSRRVRPCGRRIIYSLPRPHGGAVAPKRGSDVEVTGCFKRARRALRRGKRPRGDLAEERASEGISPPLARA